METTTQQEKALLRTIIQKIIVGDAEWLKEQDIIAQEKSGFYIVNYNQFGGGKNKYSRLVRGMVIEKPAPGAKIQDPISLIRSFPFTRFFNKAEESADKVNLGNADMLEKLDGCFSKDTKILFCDGRNIRIKEIIEKKLKGPIWGYDHKTNQIIPTKILGWHDNGLTDEWLTVKINNTHNGNGHTTIHSTPNHLFYTQDKSYLKASSLKTHTVYRIRPALPPISKYECGKFWDNYELEKNNKFKLEPTNVKEITKGNYRISKNGTRTRKYDITTKTSNFFANGILVHNSMVGVFFLNGNVKDPHWHTRRMISAHQPDRDMTLTSFHGKEHHLINLIGEYVKQISFDEKDGEYTFVFEFIHDATTVWTKYGEDKYGLHLIGARNLSDHVEMSEQELDDTAQRLGTPRPKRWDSVNDINVINSLMQQMAKEISGFEGFVFRDRETGKRIKLKDADYVRFHHMLDKLTYKNLLINVIKGETDEILSYFPNAKERMDTIYRKYTDLINRVSQEVIRWRDKNLDKKELVKKLNGRKAKRWDVKTGGPLERIPPAVKSGFTKSCILKYVDNDDDTIYQNVDEEYKKLVVGQGTNLGQLSRAMELLGLKDD